MVIIQQCCQAATHAYAHANTQKYAPFKDQAAKHVQILKSDIKQKSFFCKTGIKATFTGFLKFTKKEQLWEQICLYNNKKSS